jgi:hypothetical protein
MRSGCRFSTAGAGLALPWSLRRICCLESVVETNPAVEMQPEREAAPKNIEKEKNDDA